MIRIEPAGIKDLNNLVKLERICFPVDQWPLLDLIGALTMPGLVRLKARTEIEPMVGFVSGTVNKKQATGWITTIAVLPNFQNHGIGGQLLRACEELMKVNHIKLTVRKTNKSAIALYEKNGYGVVEIWKAYYLDGEDAILLQKSVDFIG